MIEPDDGPTEAQEIGLEGRIVGHEDFGTVKDTCGRRLIFDPSSPYLWAEPELSDGRVLRVVVTQDMPTFTGPPAHEVDQMLKVIEERGGRFGHSGVLCIPMERDGNCSWFYKVGMGMPIIETWGTYNDGSFGLISIEPAAPDFFVGANEEIGELMTGTTAVERSDSPVDSDVALPRPVFHVDDMLPGVTYNVRVPSDKEKSVAAARPVCPITPLVPVRKGVPDRFDVI